MSTSDFHWHVPAMSLRVEPCGACTHTLVVLFCSEAGTQTGQEAVSAAVRETGSAAVSETGSETGSEAGSEAVSETGSEAGGETGYI